MATVLAFVMRTAFVSLEASPSGNATNVQVSCSVSRFSCWALRTVSVRLHAIRLTSSSPKAVAPATRRTTRDELKLH